MFIDKKHIYRMDKLYRIDGTPIYMISKSEFFGVDNWRHIKHFYNKDKAIDYAQILAINDYLDIYA